MLVIGIAPSHPAISGPASPSLPAQLGMCKRGRSKLRFLLTRFRSRAGGNQVVQVDFEVGRRKDMLNSHKPSGKKKMGALYEPKPPEPSIQRAEAPALSLGPDPYVTSSGN